MAIAKGLQSLLQNEILLDEPMSRHTTWQIGGAADYFLRPQSEEELAAVLRFCSEEGMPFYIIGNGSNLLVSDKGLRGAVIQLGAAFSSVEWLEDGMWAQAGAMLTPLAMAAARRELCGMEKLAGIPGSTGGACIMNAGAYGFNISSLITELRLVEYNGRIRQFKSEDLQFSYRSSSLQQMQGAVSRVRFRLRRGSGAEALVKMRELMALRAAKQPLEYPSCGSVFKNPEGDHAGRLIEAAGLRGLRRGDAEVSLKHGNFIVNRGHAGASEVIALMEQVKDAVWEQFGIRLSAEVRLLGE